MAKFGSSNVHEGDGAYIQMIAKIQDIKAAPHHGQKRLVVREHGKVHQQAVIDIDMSAMRDIEEDETYVFNVKEKDGSRYGYQRKKLTSFKAYHCDEAPGEFTATTLTEQQFSRFAGANRLKAPAVGQRRSVAFRGGPLSAN